MKEAKEDAIYRRQDGIVIIDPVKAVGQKQLVESCPYEVIFWNEAENLPQKCTFCAHLLDNGWSEPRCVQTCPTSCLNFGDLDDPKSKVSKLLNEMKGEFWHPEFKAKPLVYYIGLPKPHLSGTVIYGDTDQCAGKATVTLMDQAGKKKKTKTDFFGDFAFKGLGNKTYTVQFEARGYESQSREVILKEEILYLGEVVLNKAK
jgi:nitrate reductase beta subunit